MIFTIPGEPVGKPRMTQRDKWRRREPVVAYHRWADVARVVARLAGSWPPLPGVVRARAFFEMPRSWPETKRVLHAGLPHRVKPDVDNVTKALLDALFERDQVVYEIHVEKRWDDGGGARLEVEVL